MENFIKIKVEEEPFNLAEVKIEATDFDPELSGVKLEPKFKMETLVTSEETLDCSTEFLDEIDIGPEFKSENLFTPDPALSNRDLSSAGSKYKLIYCPKCCETREYVARKETLCCECKTALKYKCGKCMKLYKSLGSLRSHYYRTCGKKPKLNCGYCHYKTNFKHNLAIHLESIHFPPDKSLNKCNECGKSCLQRRDLLKHLLSHNLTDLKRSLTLYLCDHCEYRTNYKSHLARHMQAKHPPPDISLDKCAKCGEIFSSRSYFLKHSLICMQPVNFKRSLIRFCCDHCQYKTNRKLSLADHISANHLPRNPNSNKCIKCGHSFSHRSNLRRHLKTCGQNRNFIRSLMCYRCDHCRYITIRKSSLAHHIQAKHSPQGPNLNKCSRCEKVYSWRSDFLRHSKMCGKTDEFKRSLLRFSCNLCQLKTNKKSRLVSHIQAKH